MIRALGVCLLLFLGSSHLQGAALATPKQAIQCPLPSAAPSHVLLDVPYFDQRDNSLQPFRSSQVTAIASVLAFYGIQPASSDISLPDEVITNVSKYGDIISSDAIIKAIRESYGVQIRFTTGATWCEVIESLRSGMPVVVIGLFGTKSGHVVTIVGYTPTHVLVNDSYGNVMTKWLELDGRNMLYPIQDFINSISPESKVNPQNIWAYFISP
jgi:hypothetical protein